MSDTVRGTSAGMETIMERKRLKAEKHLDLESGCKFRHVKSETEYFVPHCHEYYEIFLTLAGKAVHHVGDLQENVGSGYLIFIRKDDFHDYKDYDEAFEFVNLAFSEDTLNQLFSYLGEGFPAQELLHAPAPPTVKLTDNETKSLYFKLAELNAIDTAEKKLLKLKVRALLADIFTRYFSTLREKDSPIPFWLENAYEKMKSPKNFIIGKQRLFELAGMSRAHTTRLLKQYYDITPSEYINELRLSYAANLFLTSNLNATEICYECGFQNVSWFYDTFREKYGVTPAQYRREHLNAKP